MLWISFSGLQFRLSSNKSYYILFNVLYIFSKNYSTWYGGLKKKRDNCYFTEQNTKNKMHIFLINFRNVLGISKWTKSFIGFEFLNDMDINGLSLSNSLKKCCALQKNNNYNVIFNQSHCNILFGRISYLA